MSDMSYRIRHRRLGGHVHVAVWSSEYGPDATHGCNGNLVFRETEWNKFRQVLEAGRYHLGDALSPFIVFLQELDTDLVPMATNEAPKRPEGCCKAAVDSEGFAHDHAEWYMLARNRARERDALHDDLAEANRELGIIQAENMRLRRERDEVRQQLADANFLQGAIAAAADDLEDKVQRLIHRVTQEVNEHNATLQLLEEEKAARRRIVDSHNRLSGQWIKERDTAEAELKRVERVIEAAKAWAQTRNDEGVLWLATTLALVDAVNAYQSTQADEAPSPEGGTVSVDAIATMRRVTTGPARKDFSVPLDDDSSLVAGDQILADRPLET